MTVNINAANISSIRLVEQSSVSAPSGSAARVYVNNAARRRLSMVDSSGVTTFIGNTSGSGTGITFPATQDPSTDPNTLDEYEEGTWTVQIADASSGGNLSATTATGQYTRVGRFIECIFNIGPISTSGLTGANAVFIRGFPFGWGVIAVRGQGSIATENVTFSGFLTLEPVGGATACRITEVTSNAAFANITVSDLTATTAILQGRVSGIV